MMLKKFENFSGKIIKYNLLTEEVLELTSILFNLKPNLPDEFPDKELSKLINNYVTYTSEDGVYDISIILHESDTYITDDDEIVHGKYKTIFIIKIAKCDNTEFELSEIRDFYNLIDEIIKNNYDDVLSIVKIDNEKISADDFNKINKKIEKSTLIFKIL